MKALTDAEIAHAFKSDMDDRKRPSAPRVRTVPKLDQKRTKNTDQVKNTNK